jgi:hypothetical protein
MKETEKDKAVKRILNYIEKLNYLMRDSGVITREIIERQIRKFETRIREILQKDN